MDNLASIINTIITTIGSIIVRFSTLIIAIILVIFLSVTFMIFNPAYAGSGAGGIIKVENNSQHDLKVVWSGLGCGGSDGGLVLVCEVKVIKAYESYTYRYNWGVTETWFYAIGANNEYTLRCEYEDREECWKERERTVETDAWITDICGITDDPNHLFNINCRR